MSRREEIKEALTHFRNNQTRVTIVGLGYVGLPFAVAMAEFSFHKELAKIIQYVLDNHEEAEEVGWKARQKCIEKYSWNAMEKILLKIFNKYE